MISSLGTTIAVSSRLQAHLDDEVVAGGIPSISSISATGGSPSVSIPFVSSWSVPSGGVINLPLVSYGRYNFVVDWGDGTTDTITTHAQTQKSHTYSLAGNYVVTIQGQCRGWVFGAVPSSATMITNVSQWGNGFALLDAPTLETSGAFKGCSALTNITAVDVPTLAGGACLASAFQSCSLFTGAASLAQWVTSRITSLYSTFKGCTAFNQNLGSWDVSNVTDMTQLFTLASSFTNGGSASINNWDVSRVTSLQGVFQNAMLFNQPLNNWNVGEVTNFRAAFAGPYSAFNQPLSMWRPAKALTLAAMFNNNLVFNQNIGAWRTPLCTDLSDIFSTAVTFNNGGSDTIKDWVTSAVTNFSCAFRGIGAAFNQPLSGWDVSSGTDFTEMFYGDTTFNQDLSSWSMSSATTTHQMFFGATAFNNGDHTNAASKPLAWTLGSVVTIYRMFYSCVNFNQNLGSWDLRNCTTLTEAFYSCRKFNNGGSDSIKDWRLCTHSPFSASGLFWGCWVFNQPVTNWVTSQMAIGSNLFRECYSFNQPLNHLNVSKATSLSSMLQNCAALQQDISEWKPVLCTDFSNFLLSSRINVVNSSSPSTNYDRLLVEWSKEDVLPSRTLHAGSCRYSFVGIGSIATGGRLKLTATLGSGGFGWNVIDSGRPSVTFSNNGGSLQLTYTGDRPTYSKIRFMSVGALPAGLALGTDYWTIRVDSTKSKLATSLSNAIAGVSIPYVESGSGPYDFFVLDYATVASNLAGALLMTQDSTPALHNIARVRYVTTGVLPTGLLLGVDYWVVLLSTNTQRLATSVENALNSIYVPYTNSGTGVHHMIAQ